MTKYGTGEVDKSSDISTLVSVELCASERNKER